MTTQPEQAVGNESPVELSPEERLNAAFSDPANRKEEDEPEEPGLEEEPAQTEDEPEIEAEVEDELPPIDAPVSWDAEAKAVFASLPREAQEIVQKREAERERFVQQKSQEAARAKTEIEQTALTQLAQYEQSVSQQLQQLAEQIGPQRPNPALLQHDPQAFYSQQAAYESQVAQQRELQQQAQQYAQQAEQRAQQAEQAFHAQQQQKLVEHFPEYLDPTTGPKLQQELSAVAKELGYSAELIAQARADDILAMKTAADWKAKASKYDKLMADKMSKVRAAKELPRVAKPGVAQAPGAQRQQQYATDREAMRHGDQDAARRVLDSFFTKP